MHHVALQGVATSLPSSPRTSGNTRAKQQLWVASVWCVLPRRLTIAVVVAAKAGPHMTSLSMKQASDPPTEPVANAARLGARTRPWDGIEDRATLGLRAALAIASRRYCRVKGLQVRGRMGELICRTIPLSRRLARPATGVHAHRVRALARRSPEADHRPQRPSQVDRRSFGASVVASVGQGVGISSSSRHPAISEEGGKRRVRASFHRASIRGSAAVLAAGVLVR